MIVVVLSVNIVFETTALLKACHKLITDTPILGWWRYYNLIALTLLKGLLTIMKTYEYICNKWLHIAMKSQ